MEGEKFAQAQEAAQFILENLNPEDRFNLISFSTGVDMFSSRLQPAEMVDEAMAWVDRLSAIGSTDINRALLEAIGMADRERPTYLIFPTNESSRNVSTSYPTPNANNRKLLGADAARLSKIC